MHASDVSCEVIFGLVGRWLDGDMTEREIDTYEQHLLFCPPCLNQGRKVRSGISALRAAASYRPSEDEWREIRQFYESPDGGS